MKALVSLTCPCTFWQGDNKGEAEAEDEERDKKETDRDERKQDGDKVAGKEGQGFSCLLTYADVC
jgi:hypothetical protein